MTGAVNLLDNSALMLSSPEIIKRFENARNLLGWSKREMAIKSNVPYSWIVDFYRNKPLKPDMQRVQKVMHALNLPDEADPFVQNIAEKASQLNEPKRKELMTFISFLESKKE